jgi:hypothetical protein
MLQKTKPKPKMSAEVTTVTPSIAVAWLEQNKKNRPVNRHLVRRLARDMASCQWQLTGDAIRFDTEAHLIDGQHRLHACILSDTPFETAVIYNLPTDAMRVIDTGKSRNAADILSLQGFKNAALLSKIVRHSLGEVAQEKNMKAFSVSPTAIVSVIEDNPKFTLHVIPSTGFAQPVKTTHIGAITYLVENFASTSDENPMRGASKAKIQKVSEAFRHVLLSGEPYYEGDPAHAFRERMIRLKLSKSQQKPSLESQFQTLKWAYNAFACKEQVDSVRMRTGYQPLLGVDYKAAREALWGSINDLDAIEVDRSELEA